VFQRIVISPASITGIQLGHSRPFITVVNDTAHVQQLEKERKKAEQNGKG
jgi:hypothetical protein